VTGVQTCALPIFSVTDKSARAQQEKDLFDAQFIRSMTGIGASGAHHH
jgi:cation/acetate symporter